MTPTVFTTKAEAESHLGDLYAELSYLNESEGLYGEVDYFNKHRELMGEIYKWKQFLKDIS